MRLLFVCGRNRVRSPTAEQLFSAVPGVETCSAGVSPDADQPLTADLIQWADMVFVMEAAQRAKMARRFARACAASEWSASTSGTTSSTWPLNWCGCSGSGFRVRRPAWRGAGRSNPHKDFAGKRTHILRPR